MSSTAFAQLLVFTSPRSLDEELAFDQWYDQVHIPEVVALVPGIVSGRRYVLSAIQLGRSAPEEPRRRLTIYEVDPDRLEDAVAGLEAAMRDGSLSHSELVDRTTTPPEVVVYADG